jgi:hypothetical protein
MGSRLTSIIGIRAVSFKHFVGSTGIRDSTCARCGKTGFPADTQQSLTASEQREAAFAFSQPLQRWDRLIARNAFPLCRRRSSFSDSKIKNRICPVNPSAPAISSHPQQTTPNINLSKMSGSPNANCFLEIERAKARHTDTFLLFLCRVVTVLLTGATARELFRHFCSCLGFPLLSLSPNLYALSAFLSIFCV